MGEQDICLQDNAKKTERISCLEWNSNPLFSRAG